MATVAEGNSWQPLSDALSGTDRARSIDRWIFVFMAVWFIAIVLTGFIPDSLEDQCKAMFTNLKAIIAAAGAKPEDVIKMNVWLKDVGDRKALERPSALGV